MLLDCGSQPAISVNLRVRPLFAGAYASVLALSLVYVLGIARGSMMAPRAAGDLCPGTALAEIGGLTESFFPLSNECHWTNGTSTELVPAWINLLLFTLIGATVIFFVLGLWITVRTRAWRTNLDPAG
jgi:hypothetical protein